MAFVRASRLIFHFCCTFHWLCSRLAAYRDVVADLLLSAGKVINKIGMGGPNPGIARNGGGNSAPCQDVFGGFVHNALRALQSDHLSTSTSNTLHI